MIRRLRLQGYKSFVDAELSPGGLTVIFGPNDAGKSNLLDVIGLLSRLVEVDDPKRAFDPEWHRGRLIEAFHSPFGFGEEGLRELKQRDQIRFTLTIDVELQPAIVDRINRALKERERLAGAQVPYTRVVERHLRYRIEIGYDYQSGEPFICDESLIAVTPKGEPKTARKPFIEHQVGADRFTVRLERQGHPRYYPGTRHRTLLSEIGDLVYHPHVVALKEELRSWRTYYVEPSLLRRETGVHGADDPGRHGEELAAFYWKLKHEHPREFKAVGLNLHRLVPSLKGLDVRESLGTLNPLVIEENGGEFPFRLASEGTLRLLCLLGIAIAPSPPAAVAYEEPENGVQPGRLDILARIIEELAESGRTQVIVTTHSPTFLDHVRKATFVACRRDPGGNSGFLPYAEHDKLFAAQDIEEPRSLGLRLIQGG